MTLRNGTVYLVGAGPGDPGLITARGLELLRRADVVLYDRLVAPALLNEVLARARLVPVGKAPGNEGVGQTAINAALVRHARRGKLVVRLKGGDPTIFGRGWEEREACIEAGVPCEIVPGVTSAVAAPASGGVELTRRGVASSVSIIAAHGMSAQRLRRASGTDTCVFLMGVKSLPRIARVLRAAGRADTTPVAVIENGTLPHQRVLRSTLRGIARVAREDRLRSPAVVVVGPGARADRVGGPLRGQRIVVTRPQSAATAIAATLRSLGADVVAAPAFEIELHAPSAARLHERLRRADWVLFTSRHAVLGLRRALERRGSDVRALGNARVGVVGPGTARELEAWGIRADLIASPARAEALAKACLGRRPRPGRVVHPCGSLALDVVPDQLRSAGVQVDRVRVYRTVPLPIAPHVHREIARGVAGVTFASPSAVSALKALAIDRSSVPAFCIGPTTAAAARAAGWWQVHTSPEHSDDGIVATCVAVLGGASGARR